MLTFRIILLSLISLSVHLLPAQPITYAFGQVDSLMQEEERPLVVFIHTDWCRYCNAMKNTTFQDEAVIELLNENFYFLSLDGEEKRDITFRNYTFSFQPTGNGSGVHQLAAQLGTTDDGELSFPVLVILNPQYEIVFQYSGFLSGKALKKVLKKMAE